MDTNPLGLMPKEIHNLKRMRDILDAIERYSVAGLPVPVEWVTELKDLLGVH